MPVEVFNAQERVAKEEPITGFVPYQHPVKVDAPPDGPEWIHEIKFDGYRLQAHVAAGQVKLYTRNGHDWTVRFPDLADDLSDLPDCVLDGELCAVDAEGQPDFSALQAAVRSRRNAGALVYFPFDVLSREGVDLRSRPLVERKAALASIVSLATSSRVRRVDHFEQGGRALLQSACELRLEGIVSKRKDAPYQTGQRSDAWRKAKCRPTVEVAIVGWRSDGPTLRYLLAAARDGDRLRYAGRIQTGFSGRNAAGLITRLKELATDLPPAELTGRPSSSTGVQWVAPLIHAELDVAEVTASGKLRQASFRRWRDEAASGQVDVLAAAASPKPRPRARPSEPPPQEHARVAPHPNAEAIKDYLSKVAEWVIPYLKGRPCSVLLMPAKPPRTDDFERHADQRKSSIALDERVGRIEVASTGKGYFTFDDLPALKAAVDAGAVEFHPWQSLPAQPDLAGRFIVDLDPGEGVEFAQVIEGAHLVREHLRRLGLISFVKTTGGKGLHVVAPFEQAPDRPVGWTRSKAFIRRACETLAAADPKMFTAKLAKSERGGRLFLDYLRNGQTNTAAALLTPRLREGLPVSMPLRWEDLDERLQPMMFDMKTAAERLSGEADPWAGYASGRPVLADLL